MSDEMRTNILKTMGIDKEFKDKKDGAAKIRFTMEKLGGLPVSKVFQPKDDSASIIARKSGNNFFIADKDYVSALKCYNRSICLATDGSEHLAIGYANRSAIYLNSGFYKLCLENIGLALKGYYPEKLRPKLEQRKKECLDLMNNHVDGLEKFNKEKIEVKLSYPANERMPLMIEGLEYATSEKFGRHIRTKRDLYPGNIYCLYSS